MSIKGKKIVFTGTMSKTRDEMKAEAEQAGGDFRTSVSEQTDILVCGEGVIESAKNRKYKLAVKFGITIIDEAKYRKSYLKSTSSDTSLKEEDSMSNVDIANFYATFSKETLQKILTSLGCAVKKTWKKDQMVEKISHYAVTEVLNTFTSVLLKEGLESLELPSSGRKNVRYERLLNALTSKDSEESEKVEEDLQSISKYTEKLDQLFLVGEEGAQQGFTILESLIDNPLYVQYYIEMISIDKQGVIHSIKDFSYDVVVDLLSELIQYDEGFKNSITHLNLANYSKKADIPYTISKLPNLFYLDVSNATYDYEDATFTSLLNTLESMKQLTHLRIRDCSQLQTLPEFFKELEGISLRGCHLSEIRKEKFRLLPTHLKLAYVEYTVASWGRQNRFDSEMEELIEHFEGHMSSDWNANLKIDEAHFHGPLTFSSHVLLVARQKFELDLSEITDIEMNSRFVDLLTEMPKLTNLTIHVELDCDTIRLSSHRKLTFLKLYNFPKTLYLTKDKLRHLTFSGDLTRCQKIYRARKKYEDFYEGLSGINASEFYYNTKETLLPPPTKKSLLFIKDSIKNTAWRHKDYRFWKALLDLDANVRREKAKELVDIAEQESSIFGVWTPWTRRYISSPQKRGKWMIFGDYDFLVGYFQSKYPKLLSGYIKLTSSYISTLQQSCEGLFVTLENAKPIDFTKQKCQHLTLRAHRKHQFTSSLPSTITELKMENVVISPELLDVCAKNLEVLTLCSVNIQGTLDFSSFPKLRILKLIHCGLTSLGKLPKKLKLLNISGNPLKQFPKTILKCTQIEALQMSSCAFTKIPKEIQKCTTIRSFSLCTSLVEDIDFLTRLPNLEELRIGYAGETSNWLWNTNPKQRPTKVPSIPAGLTSLKRLYVNGITWVKPGDYHNHELDLLDIHMSTEATGQHLLKQFKYVKKIIGFQSFNTEPTPQDTTNSHIQPKMQFHSTIERTLCQNMPWNYCYRDFEPSDKLTRGWKQYQNIKSSSI